MSTTTLQKRFFWTAIAFCVTCLGTLVILMVNNGHKAVITMTPTQKNLDIEWNVSVVPAEIASGIEGQNVLPGQLLKVTAQSTPIVSANSDLKSRGQITVHNKNNKEQTLVATTRFLSKDNILFRLPKQITIPAGGSVNTELVADQTGPKGDVSAGKFTIPGLSKNLQEKIYGESTSAFVGGTPVQNSGNITISDLKQWQEPAKAELEKMVTTPYVLIPDSLTKFDNKDQIKVLGVSYDPATARMYALKALSARLPVGFNADEKNISITFKKATFDEAKNTANISFTVSSPALFNPDQVNIDWNKVISAPVDEAKKHLSSIPGISNVDITIVPSWRNNMPDSRSKINLQTGK